VAGHYAHLSDDGYRLSRAASARFRHSLADAPQLLDFRAQLSVREDREFVASFKELVSVALHFTIFFLAMFAIAWFVATAIGAGERCAAP
jgi:hypothetical protein